MKRISPEVITIGAFLAAAITFGLWVLPAAIAPGDSSQGAGLSPRFMPRLAVASTVLALAWGLFRSLVGNRQAEQQARRPREQILTPIYGVAICIVFAGIGFELAGLYLGGILMAVLLTLLLGERRPWVIILFPAVLLAAIYVLFELALNIRLPRLGLIPGLPI